MKSQAFQMNSGSNNLFLLFVVEGKTELLKQVNVYCWFFVKKQSLFSSLAARLTCFQVRVTTFPERYNFVSPRLSGHHIKSHHGASFRDSSKSPEKRN